MILPKFLSVPVSSIDNNNLFKIAEYSERDTPKGGLSVATVRDIVGFARTLLARVCKQKKFSLTFSFVFQTFTANTDRSTIVYNRFMRPIRALYLRVHPTSWQSMICMRVELFGCQGINI